MVGAQIPERMGRARRVMFFLEEDRPSRWARFRTTNRL